MIPKIIHYCWLGDAALSKKEEKCIASWKKYCPDYEIKLWNEDNVPISKYPYMKEAYEEKAWAFVPDMIRLMVVSNWGGVYLDTDVEVVRSLDPLLTEKAYFGIERDKGVAADVPYISLGLGFGAEKGNPVVKKLLRYYETHHFRNPDGTVNKLASPGIQTRDFIEMGWEQKDELSHVEGATIFPSDYFDPKSPFYDKITITENTYSIHHYTGSWLPHRSATRKALILCKRMLGEQRYRSIKNFLKG